jgi:hypothetical protein
MGVAEAAATIQQEAYMKKKKKKEEENSISTSPIGKPKQRVLNAFRSAPYVFIS